MIDNVLDGMAGAAGAAGEATYVEDVFSTYLYTGNGSRQVIQNNIRLGDAGAGGSVYFDGSVDSLNVSSGSWGNYGTGDFTLEAWVNPDTNTAIQVISDARGNNTLIAWQFYINASGKLVFYGGSTGGTTTGATTISAGQWTHVAVSRLSGSLKLFVNGTVDATATVTANLDCGETTYIGRTYDASGTLYYSGYISNFRSVIGTAVYTSTFTSPTSALTAVSGTSLLCCQGDAPFTDNSTNAFTLIQNGNLTAKAFGPFTSDVAGEGGLVWIKTRDVGNNHSLQDTERGTSVYLQTNSTNAQETRTDLITSFNSDGFTLGVDASLGTTNFNGNGGYTSWTFRKAPKFFDIVTYTGNGTTQNIPHNLGSAPGMVIIKSTSNISYWMAWNRGSSSKMGQFESTTNFSGADYSECLGAVPTDTHLLIQGSSTGRVNTAGYTYVAYLFAHDAGGFGKSGEESIIKCGSYIGTGSGSVSVDLGWEPQWLLIKQTDGVSAKNWWVIDNIRGMPVAAYPYDAIIAANLSDAELSGVDIVLPTATGFEVNNTGQSNLSGVTYVYMAIRRGPMKTPEDGTTVFTPAVELVSSNIPVTTNFPADLAISTQRSMTEINRFYTFDRLRGSGNYIGTNSTNPEASTGLTTSFNSSMTSYIDNYSNPVFGETSSYGSNIYWAFRRAPGFFDIVRYIGTGNTYAVTHNLGVAPELILIKDITSTANWGVYAAPLTATKYLILNTTAAGATSSTFWDNTEPTDTAFTVKSNAAVNSSGVGSENYIAYLFASCPGVSKIGSYTGTGTTLQVNCGFSNGARFVLIKRTDSTGDWYVWDTARGIATAGDPYLLLNSTNAEVVISDYIDPYSDGFEISSSAPDAINASGGTFIYLAIA